MPVNKLILVGRVGQTPEITYHSWGAVCNFSVAVNKKYKDKGSGELVEKTDWFRVSTFNRQAETCAEYLLKGSEVYVEGPMESRTSVKDGVTHPAWEVKASGVTFLGGKKEAPDERQDPISEAKELFMPPPTQKTAESSRQYAPAPYPGSTYNER